jgi:hypothetical protein
MRSSQRLLVSREIAFSLSYIDPRTAVTVEDLQAYTKKLLSNVSLKILVVGNMHKQVSAQQRSRLLSNPPDSLATGSDRSRRNCREAS